MERRKFVVGLGALAAGSSAAMGTGAFTQMQTDGRDASIAVTNDSDGLIALVPDLNGDLVEEDGGELDIDVADAMGDGINVNSVYEFGEFDNEIELDRQDFHEESPLISWLGTEYNDDTKGKTRITGVDTESGGNAEIRAENYAQGMETSDVSVNSGAFRVINQSTVDRDITLEFSGELGHQLGTTSTYALGFNDVGPGDAIEVAFVVDASDEQVEADGTLTVSAE